MVPSPVPRHFDALTSFLHEPGVPLDNNLAERLLKLVVRGRKNSGFFKTNIGTGVGDVVASVLATCHESAINTFGYCAVQRHAEALRQEPERWMPWNHPKELGGTWSDRPITRARRELTGSLMVRTPLPNEASAFSPSTPGDSGIVR